MTDHTTPGGDVAEETAAPWTVEALLAVEAAVLAVPGVTDLYRPRPTIGGAVAAVRRLASGRAGAAGARVGVDGSVLRLAIGTDGTAPAPGVAHAVHDAALEAAQAGGRTPTRIDVRVARIG
ncbi:hypothetical protein [Curtobacterium sp. MCBD17_032]|uniref:hypothetical protein n=1 Tax=Curtobacterium sp. MCBD17_032 TaxID=2175659 RepID=UPI000DA98DD3|nr:hypothetical protein [Curtobacterium sp. MCBD17_032]PZE85170.1 hypothetical protein DEI91_06990 [Curtobacterium sp. MCBD17_032]